MPRDGSGVYSKPAGTTASPNTTIESAKYNSVVDDLVVDANTARPITAGGTGSTTVAAARDALGLEIGVDIPAFAQIGVPFNLGLAVSVAGNALTIALKGADGNDPSASNVVSVPFRSATAATGTVAVRSVTAATSLVVSSGSTLGTTSAVAATLVVVGFDDAGTFRLGVVNPTALPIKDGIASSTAEGGAGAADTAGTIYTGTAVTSKAMVVLGFITITEATAGTWASAPTTVQVGSAPAVGQNTPIITPWVSYTPTFTNFGTVTGVSAWSRRVGDTLQVRAKFTTGTTVVAQASMSFGFNGTNLNVTSDATKVSSIQIAGSGILSINAATGLFTLIESAVNALVFGYQSGTTAGLTKLTGSQFGDGTTVSITADIPISGW